MSGPGAGLDVAVPGGRCQPCSIQVFREQDPHSAVQSPSAFVPALPPAARAWSQGQPSPTPHPATLGDICACCCDTGGIWSPPHSSLGAGQMLLLDSWTLARMGCPRRPGLAGDGAGTLVRTKPQISGASLPAQAPQPFSAWGSAPPGHHSRTAWPCWLCMAWGHVRTLSLPLDLSSHSGCPHPLSDPGLDRPCVVTDLTAAPGATVAPLPHPFTAKACPSSVGTAPLTPGLMGGTSPIFLNKIIVS